MIRSSSEPWSADIDIALHVLYIGVDAGRAGNASVVGVIVDEIGGLIWADKPVSLTIDRFRDCEGIKGEVEVSSLSSGLQPRC